MANIERLEQKLKDLITKDSNFAVALTGDWGIGKTHFWKAFLNNNKAILKGSKYAYVSLFGIDSLESLKLAIATEVHKPAKSNSALDKDIIKTLKNVFGFVGGGSTSATTGDLRFGINIGDKIVTNLMMAHLKNTLVCLDDIERKSANLPMSEVMGLINYLKNERDCQVIMLLNNEESEDREYFDRHKEKVFDEVLILDDSLSILRNQIVTDDTLYPIYEKLYQTIGIKNIRFYKRVQKTYEQIISHSNTLSLSSKQEILKQVLIIRLVYDMPNILDIDMNTFQIYFTEGYLDARFEARQYGTEEENSELERKINKAQRTIEKFHDKFRLDRWATIVINALTNSSVDEEHLEEIAKQDLLEQHRLNIETQLHSLDIEFSSLQPKPDYSQRLFDAVKAGINTLNLNQLSRYCRTLKLNGEIALADELIDLIKTIIQTKVSQDPNRYNQAYWYQGEINDLNIFSDYLEEVLSSYQPEKERENKLNRLFDEYFHNKTVDKSIPDNVLLDITKTEFRDIIWKPLSSESDRKDYIYRVLKYPVFNQPTVGHNNLGSLFWRLSTVPISSVKIFDNHIFITKKDILKQWVLELLQEKIVENPESRAPIEMWLESSNNLEYV